MGKNFCNVEYKWCKYLKHNGVCGYCGSNTSNIDICPRIKEIETVRLYDLLQDVEFDAVFTALIKWYTDQEDNRDGYEKVFEIVRSLTPKRHRLTDLFIDVGVVKDDGYDNEYLDVDGINIINNNGISYGLEFCPWVDWVSMFITKESIDNLSKEEIVAGCLYEMTFFGFEEKKVLNKKQELIDSISKIKNKQQETA